MSFLSLDRYRTRREDRLDAQVRPCKSRDPRRRRRSSRCRRSPSSSHADVRAIGSQEETEDRRILFRGWTGGGAVTWRREEEITDGEPGTGVWVD